MNEKSGAGASAQDDGAGHAGEARALHDACISPSELERVAAFERLGQMFYRMLWPRVARDPRLQHLAVDCAQDALVKVWEHLDEDRGPDDPERFIGWATRIATNTLLDELRRLQPVTRVHRSKRVALSQQLRMDVAATEAGRPLSERLADENVPDADHRLAYQEIHALLSEIHHVRSVSENSRTVLLKGFLEGWEDEELAEHLDTSRRNVHVIRCRDLAKLRSDPSFMDRLRPYYDAIEDDASVHAPESGQGGAS
jgi:RNA polymerase sigma factor (sigma-70 family)